MTAPGAVLLDQADLASRARAFVIAMLAASLGQGGMLMLGSREQLLRPGRPGLAAAEPHVHRKAA